MKRQSVTLIVAVFVTSFLLPPSSFGSDAAFEAPREAGEKKIPLIEPTPAKEDSLDRLKNLFERPQAPQKPPGENLKDIAAENERDMLSPVGRVVHQLRDYNWQENVNIRIGGFTILGYRDATTNDFMLFRFLTPEEHAEKRVMNSKASLLGQKPMNTSMGKNMECGGSTPPSSARLDAPN